MIVGLIGNQICLYLESPADGVPFVFNPEDFPPMDYAEEVEINGHDFLTFLWFEFYNYKTEQCERFVRTVAFALFME